MAGTGTNGGFRGTGHGLRKNSIGGRGQQPMDDNGMDDNGMDDNSR